MPRTYRELRLILGDQLNRQHSWFQEKDKEVLYVLMECTSETGYVRHHIQKIIGFFLAMRAFAEWLRGEGHEVLYLKLDDEGNQGTILENTKMLVKQYSATSFTYQYPDEWRLDQQLQQLCKELNIATNAVDSEHFLSRRHEVAEFFKGKKQFLMESFYRHMRKKYRILMEENGEEPFSGRWNYDQENRKKLPQKVAIPEPLHFERDVSDLVYLLEKLEVKTMGSVDAGRFTWPVTREEGLQLLDHFIKNSLQDFGTYQDAMTDRNYLLFHSKLSFLLNTKILHPLEVVKKCINYWQKQRDKIDIAQIEGFVRQIIGWREYMRGIYWAKMPDFAGLNYFGHDAPLPDFYWTGQTNMKCLREAVGQSLEQAYAHHIQRLMVTGNFALLLGVDPDEVDEWYLGIYMDAIEWVEITNTRGMSQYADGGIIGTKPYVSSANYIHKMSDYCGDCAYKHTKKYGEGACPFNSLYWDFYDRHRKKLSNNPRVGMMYRVWDKMDGKEKEEILKQADQYKRSVNDL
jgi:deoxyribodipyrimidine photolyase-related protein